MCGRYNLRTPPAQLVEIFELARSFEASPRYNIAPTQTVLAVRQEDIGRVPVFLHWGLIPGWAKDPAIGSRMLNARGETVATKPSFRSAFRRRRCLIPADGFYEWQKTGARGRPKQPYHIHRADNLPFAFAGLWEHWQGSGSDPIDSCTIITTNANELLSGIHDRMPVILHPADYDRWLDPANNRPEDLEALLEPYPAEELAMEAVSTVVNNARHETADCLKPVDPP